jgi:hypothetical protein
MPPKQTTAKTAVHDDTPLNQTSEPTMAISSRQDYLALAAAASIHQDDDVEQALDWIEKGGRVNASRLAKKLPHTARGLADGSTDPDALANNLISGLVERAAAQSLINADGTVRLARGEGTSDSGNQEERSDILDLLGFVFTRMAVPFQDNEELGYGFYCDMKVNIRKAMLDQQSPSEPNDVLFKKVIKRAFDETCVAWEDRLTVSLFRGQPEGAFRRSCKLFNAPLEEFDRVLREDFHSKIDRDSDRMDADTVERLRRGLHMAAGGISQGLHEVTKTCWECDARLETRKECTGCGVALYCGRGCQVRAWKGGHKKTCKDLSEKWKSWKASLSAVDAAHASGILYGIQLRAELDYRLLSSIYAMPSPFAGTSCEHELVGPSMDVFYENLGRVIRGKWWFYDDTASLSGYKEFLQTSRKTLEEEAHYFAMLNFFLLFDYFKHAAIVSGIQDPDLITAMFDSSSFVGRSSQDFGIPMPADRFLELYKGNNTATRKDERLGIRKHMNSSALKDFRDSFHKG